MLVTVTYISWSLILHYILKTIWRMNIILWDYGSVWPQNKCMSLWPIFHDPVILPYVLKTIWRMSVIFSNNETGWPKLWPKNKYRSTWLIFHGLVIFLNIFKIVWWMNIIVGIMDQLISSSTCCFINSVTIWWSYKNFSKRKLAS